MQYFLQQTKNMFLAGVVSYFEGMERIDLDRNTVIDLKEFRKFMELQWDTGKEERASIVLKAEKETLFGAAELLATLSPFNKKDPIAVRSIQYVATKILKLEGKTVADGSLDTVIGKNTIADVVAATGIEVKNGKITSEHITKLAEKARALAGEQTPEAPKTALEMMKHFDKIEVVIVKGDSLSKALRRAFPKQDEAVNEILGAIEEKFEGFKIGKVWEWDTFTFMNPEGGNLALSIVQKNKTYAEKVLVWEEIITGKIERTAEIPVITGQIKRN